MKPEAINALYEKMTTGEWNVGRYGGGIETSERTVIYDEGHSVDDEAGICALKNGWPSIYRELMAARAMRDAYEWFFAGELLHDEGVISAYDAARQEADK